MVFAKSNLIQLSAIATVVQIMAIVVFNYVMVGYKEVTALA